MNYQSVLYGPVYRLQGVLATITLRSGTVLEGVRVLDKSAGFAIPGEVEVESLRPAAIVTAGALLARGIQIDEVDQATIIMNNGTWRIISYKLEPSPNGVADGEVFLFLEGGP